jgi:hypothetical protein
VQNWWDCNYGFIIDNRARGSANPLTLAVGVGSLAALVLLAKVAPRVPRWSRRPR